MFSSTHTHAHAREPEGAGVVAEASQRAQSRETKPVSPELAELQKPEIIKQFTKLQTLVKDTIQPIGKLRILRATKRHGFTLPHLRWAFEKHGGGLNMAGGLVKFAEEWEEYTAGVCLPACGKCLDAGVLECPQGDENSQGFCGCEAGRKMAQSALEREKETEVCPYCHDTGRESFQYCQCSKGLELEAEEMGLQISDLASMVNAGAVLKSSQAKIPVAWT